MQPSSHKQFAYDAQYWIEVRHQDHCAFCKDAVRNDCASAPKDAPTRRTRVAQFIYFMEAIDYAQALQKAGVQCWLRKPRYKTIENGNRERVIESDYSHYDLKPLLQSPIVLDGKPGVAVSA
jgi:hypothetical protein